MHFLLQDWFFSALASTIVIGILMSLFKLPSTKRFSKYQLNVYSSGVATIFAGLYAFPSIHINMVVIGVAVFWAFFYLATTIAQMKSLEYIESSSIFPFTSLLSNIFIILIGVLFWQDHITPIQTGAILLAVIIFFLHSYRGRLSFHAIILPLFFFIATSSTVAKSFQKYGSVVEADNLVNFVFWQMLGLFILSFLLALVREKRGFFQMDMNLKSVGFITLFGLLQLLANVLMVMGLSHGPISLIYVINGFYVFITVAICVLFFGEKITRKQIILMTLSFFTILAIKLGGI